MTHGQAAGGAALQIFQRQISQGHRDGFFNANRAGHTGHRMKRQFNVVRGELGFWCLRLNLGL